MFCTRDGSVESEHLWSCVKNGPSLYICIYGYIIYNIYMFYTDSTILGIPTSHCQVILQESRESEALGRVWSQRQRKRPWLPRPAPRWPSWVFWAQCSVSAISCNINYKKLPSLFHHHIKTKKCWCRQTESYWRHGLTTASRPIGCCNNVPTTPSTSKAQLVQLLAHEVYPRNSQQTWLG